MYESWIFTIGNEVVQGRVVNTNASYLGRKLTLLGYNVRGNISVVDDVDLIAYFIELVLHTADLIITTGGLGPTYDDRTSEALAKALNTQLELNSDALEMIRSKYSALNLPLTNERVKMALLPKGSKPIYNPVGTAPGIHIEVNGKLIIALPGVPKEMEAMFELYVEPLLRSRGPKIEFVEREFDVYNLPESTAAEVVNSVLRKYANIYIKTHPKGAELGKPVITVYVSASSKVRRDAEELVSSVCSELKRGFAERGGVIEETR